MTLSYNVAVVDLSNADPALRLDIINLIKGRGAFISVYDEYPQGMCPAEEWAESEEEAGEARTETTHVSECEPTGEYEPSIINAWLESEQESEPNDSSRSEEHTDETDNEEEGQEWVDVDSPAHSMELMEQILDELVSAGSGELDMEEEWVDEVDGGEYEHHVVVESEADNGAEQLVQAHAGLQHTIDRITDVLGMPPTRPGQSDASLEEGEEGERTRDSPSYEELLAHINRIVDARPAPLTHTDAFPDVTIPAIAPAEESGAAPDNHNQADLPDIEQIRAEIQREMDAVSTPGHVAFH